MITLNVKITANGKKSGQFQINGTAEEQDALWECLDIIMPSPIRALEKLLTKKEVKCQEN